MINQFKVSQLLPALDRVTKLLTCCNPGMPARTI